MRIVQRACKARFRTTCLRSAATTCDSDSGLTATIRHATRFDTVGVLPYHGSHAMENDRTSRDARITGGGRFRVRSNQASGKEG